MQNLAGNAQCDEYIARELERARIPTVTVEKNPGEVAYTIMGKWRGFEFRRAWYYWVVTGKVPLLLAQDLYKDPVGKTDIRAAGDCACRPPENWANYYHVKTGRKVFDFKEKRECQRLLTSESCLAEIAEKILDTHEFADKPAAVGQGYVELYHIDSEVGLRLFVDAIRGVKWQKIAK